MVVETWAGAEVMGVRTLVVEVEVVVVVTVIVAVDILEAVAMAIVVAVVVAVTAVVGVVVEVELEAAVEAEAEADLAPLRAASSVPILFVDSGPSVIALNPLRGCLLPLLCGPPISSWDLTLCGHPHYTCGL